jgi:ABC-type Fe3+ transport system substrate-binding protein
VTSLRRRAKAFTPLCAVIALLVACAPAVPVTPPVQPTAAVAPALTRFGPKFQALLDKAKQGNGHLRAGLSAYTPEFIKAMEQQFGQEFGIAITLENEPGHASREIPPKMVQAQKVGKGLVDWIDGGNPSNFAPLMQQDALQIPPWEALTEQWPQIADLRKLYPDVPGGPNGTSLQSYCMLASQTAWAFVYNTRNVKPEDVQGIKWDDLLTEKWKGRVAWDAQGLGFKELPFHKDWPITRLKAFTTNLGVNQVKMIDGGSNGVIQAVIQGEGDIGMATADTVLDQISSGAPLGLAWPDIIPFNSLGTCVPKITVDNEALAQVFFAWRNIEGEWLRAQMGSGGARPFFAPEADKFPLARIAREAGITDARLAQPKTPADFDKVEENRKVAIDGMKAGLQSGQKLPYP